MFQYIDNVPCFYLIARQKTPTLQHWGKFRLLNTLIGSGVHFKY